MDTEVIVFPTYSSRHRVDPRQGAHLFSFLGGFENIGFLMLLAEVAISAGNLR